MNWVPIILLGFVFGLQHSLDGDHIVAVATIVSEHRSVKKSSWIGALWGLGHTSSLLVVGVLVIVLRLSIPSTMAQGMEFSVGVMLVALGVNAIRNLRRPHHLHVHIHEHEGTEHSHFHVHAAAAEHDHGHPHTAIGPRPFLIGIVHGMAGSAALMLLVLTTIPSPWTGVLYIIVFGAGSIAGMLIMSAMIGLPFALTAKRFSRWNRHLQFVAGSFSLVFGFFISANIASAWLR